MDVTALVEIDWQGWITALGHDPGAVGRAREVRRVARAASAPVLCTRYLSRDPADPLRSDPRGEGASFLSGLTPGAGDPVVTKYGRDVFDAPGFDQVLSSLSVGRVVLTGVATDQGVADAARSALARGLRVVVIGDASAGLDASAHERALRELEAAGAVIATAEDASRGGWWADNPIP